MEEAMSIKVQEIELRVLNMRTRMPFRYGIAALTALPHLFVRCIVDVNGKTHAGIAADGLPPKWFTKDPHTHTDIAPAGRLDDGRPQSLEACIRAYHLTHFKIKLCGDADRDMDRLLRIAGILEATGADYALTLDGNEQYHAVAPFQALWE